MKKVYFIRYENWHVDRFPFLYVIFSNHKDTIGINLHYLGALFSPYSFKYNPTPIRESLLKLGQYRKHTALKRFFEFVESPKFAKLGIRARYDILKARWPKIIKIMYRHYKTKEIRILWEQPKDNISEVIQDQIRSN